MRLLRRTCSQLALALALAQLIFCCCTTSAAMVKPGWTDEIATTGRECFDASAAHLPPRAPSWMPGVQNNTRWTHWAVPDGPPPPAGWPVIVTFEVMGYFPVEGDNSTCGDGWHGHGGGPPPPPLSAKCKRMIKEVETNCSAARATGNHTICSRCEYRVRSTAREEDNATDCSMRQLYEFCPPAPLKPGKRKYNRGHHSALHPFAGPQHVLAPEFLPNGSWAGEGGFQSADGGFDAHAGLLWLQVCLCSCLCSQFSLWVPDHGLQNVVISSLLRRS
jgi:hypothetical protein